MNPLKPSGSCLLLPAIAALAYTSPAAKAQVLDWDKGGGADQSFVQPLNWSTDALPTPTNDVRAGDGAVITISPGEDAVFKQMFLGDPLNGPNNPQAGTGGDVNGTLIMTGGTVMAQNIRLGTDNTGGSTGGTGTFTMTDGAITLIELENNSQAMEIGRSGNATGIFIMGDGDTTSPTFNYSQGRFEVGNVGTATSLFEFRSGTVTGTDNFIIGQANGIGTATAIIGGFDQPAVFSTTTDLNMNQHDSSLSIDSNGSVTSRDLQFASNANRNSRVVINAGGVYTNNRDMNDRAGTSTLDVGGTLNFNNASAPGTAGREREVENLTLRDGAALKFRIRSGAPNSILPLQVEGDDAKTASVTGTVTLDLEVIPTGNNSATLDTWTAGSANWSTASPDDSQWDLGLAPENVDAIAPGNTYRLIQSDVASGTTAITTDLTTAVVPADPLAWQINTVLDLNSDVVGYEAESLTQTPVSPATAVFNNAADDVTVGLLPTDSLVVAPEVGADAGRLDLLAVGTFAVAGDVNIGGSVQGTVNQGTLNGGGAMAVTIGDDLVFGDGGTQGGFYNLNEGTLTVTGDIIEGTDDPNAPDSAVNNAQLIVNTGTVAANALSVGGSSTTQRFALAEQNGSVAGLTLSSTSGFSSLATSGTLAIGAGVNSSKDGDPATVSGATGELVVGTGGTVNALNMRVGENGDSSGTLTIDGGSVTVSTTSYIGGGETNDSDSETSGTLNLISGSFTAGANTEIGRDGAGSLTIDGGTFTQSDANLVLGQSGGAHLAEGTVVVNGGTVNVGVAGGSATPSDLNINNSGGTVTQNGGDVVIERNLNMASLDEPSSYTLNSGTLTVGQDLASRAGDGADTLTVAGGTLAVGRNVAFTGGTANSIEIIGSTGGFTVAGNLNANAGTAFSFTADASGVTPIDITGTLQLNAATIAVDVSALGLASAFDMATITLATTPSVTGAFGNVAFDDAVPGIIFADGSGYILRNSGGAVFLEAANTRDPFADDDGDTIVNIIEDAFGSDSLDPNDGFDDLPTVTTDGTSATIVFQQEQAGDSFIYEIQRSTDGESWAFLPGVPVLSADQTGLPTGFERRELSVTIDAAEPVILLRMNILAD